MRQNKDVRLRLTERQWKLMERALELCPPGATFTTADIDTLYYRVKRRNEQRAALKDSKPVSC